MNSRRLLKLSYVLLTFSWSCTSTSSHNSPTTKFLNYGSFTLEVPKQWQPEKIEIEDSFVGNIYIGHGKFINFDLGAYSNDLNEDGDINYQVRSGKLYVLDKTISRTSSPHYVEYGPATESNLNRVRNNIVESITIDGYKAKLVQQKKPGIGITGVYIDSLWKDSFSRTRFQMNGQKLTKTESDQLLYAIRTLKFYHKPTKNP